MKKLIKKEICGSVNSASVAATVHVPYMNSTACWGKGVKKKKEKKKGKRRNLKRSKRWIQTVPKSIIIKSRSHRFKIYK